MTRKRRGMGISLASAVALAAGLSDPARAQLSTWTNALGNNNWGQAGNWNPQGVPANGANVLIPGGFPPVNTGGATLNQLTAMSPINLSNGQITLAAASSVQAITVTNGTFTVSAPFIIGGDSTMGGASFGGTSFYRNEGTMTVSPGASINGVTLENANKIRVFGTLVLAGTAAQLDNSGALELWAAGRVNSTGIVVNTGIIRKTDPLQSVIEARLLQGGGSINVEEGTLSQSGPAEFVEGGTIVVQGGATYRLDNPTPTPHKFAGIGSVSGGGDMVIAPVGNSLSPPIQVLAPVTFNLTGPSGARFVSGNTLLNATLRNTGKVTFGAHTFQGTGELRNDPGGTITVEPSGGLGLTLGATLVNKGVFNLGGPITIVQTTATNDAGGTVTWTGSGQVQGQASNGRFVNNGTFRRLGGSGNVVISYDQAFGGTIMLDGGSITMTAGGVWGSGGGRFELTGVSPVHSFTAGSPFIVTAGNHVITGNGRAELAPNTTLRVDAAATLELSVFSNPPTPDAEFQLKGILGGPGAITNKGQCTTIGTIGINDQADFRNDGLAFIAGGTLRGFFTNNVQRQVIHLGNWTMTGGKAFNHGDWITSPAGNLALMIGATGEFTNYGNLVHFPPQTQSGTIQAKFDNQGTVVVERGILQFSGQVVQLAAGVLSGGTWVVKTGATLILPPPLTKITSSAHVIGGTQAQQGVQGLGGVGEISGGGKLDITGSTAFNGQLNIFNGGRLLVRAPATATIPTKLYLGWMKPSRVEQKRQGEAPQEPRIVTPILENAALAAPGGQNEPGPFNLTGTYQQTTQGTLEIEIGGTTPVDEHDRMDVTGPAMLAGTLDLSLLGGFVPAMGQSFTILTATGGVTGQFTDVNQPATMPPGLRFNAVYTPSSVSVVAASTCYPDCTGEGALTIADFGCFQTKFVQGDPYADCTLDGVLTIADFGCFQTKFVQGCP